MQKWGFVAAGFLSSLIYSTVGFAEQNHSVITLSGGVAFNNDAGASIFIPATDEVFSSFNYHAKHATHPYAQYGGFFGEEFALKPHWALQAGIGFYQSAQLNANGLVTQGVDEDSLNTYSYKYMIRSYQFLAEGKLLYAMQRYHPYVSFGVGAVYNDTHGFNVDIQPPYTTVSNQFNNRSITSASYTAGLGMDVDICDHTRLGIGYRFANQGRAYTGKSVIDTVETNNALEQEHLYVNSVLAQFTYVV
jgi:opacity protein-like surface antigen